MKNLASVIFLLLVAASAAHMAFYYPQLPDTVASHFGPSGEPDGWSSKKSFITIYAVLVGVIAASFFGLALCLPRFPTSMINLPNREYWLAPERRAESLATLTSNLLWLGNLTLLFILAVMHLSFEVNLGHRSALGGLFYALLGGFMFLMICSTIQLMRRFRIPREGVGE